LKKFLKGKEGQFCKTCSQRIDLNPLRVFDCKLASCGQALEEAPKIADYICDEDKEHFKDVRSFLDLAGVKYVLDPHLVRGFDYYTRTTFEVLLETLGSQNALAGGGRYDYLIEDYGGISEPAIGFALGTERIMLAFETQKISIFTKPDLDVLVISVEAAQKLPAFKVLTFLRDKHFNTIMAFDDKSLKAQLKMADKMQAKAALIVGEEEVKSGKYTLRFLETGKQEKLSLKEVAEKL
jgi:histidyl-tRNA synthetase